MIERFPDRCPACGSRLFSVSARSATSRVIACTHCLKETVLPVIPEGWLLNDRELDRLLHPAET